MSGYDVFYPPLFSPLPTPAQLLGAARPAPLQNQPAPWMTPTPLAYPSGLQPLTPYITPYATPATHLSLPSPVEVLNTSGQLNQSQNPIVASQPPSPPQPPVAPATVVAPPYVRPQTPQLQPPLSPQEGGAPLVSASTAREPAPSITAPEPTLPIPAVADPLPPVADNRPLIEQYPQLAQGINASRSVQPEFLKPEVAKPAPELVPVPPLPPPSRRRVPSSTPVSQNQNQENTRVSPDALRADTLAGTQPLPVRKASRPKEASLKAGPINRAQHTVSQTLKGGFLGAGAGLSVGLVASALTFMRLRKVPPFFKAPVVRYAWLQGVLNRTAETLNASPIRPQLFALGKRVMMLLPPFVGVGVGTLGGAFAGAVSTVFEKKKYAASDKPATVPLRVIS